MKKIIVQTKTAGYTVAVGDNYVRADATSGNITMTLQVASAYVTNKRIRFKKIDSGTNTVTIAAGGSDTIDGSATYVLTSANQGVEIMQTASNKWDVVGKF